MIASAFFSWPTAWLVLYSSFCVPHCLAIRHRWTLCFLLSFPGLMRYEIKYSGLPSFFFFLPWQIKSWIRIKFERSVFKGHCRIYLVSRKYRPLYREAESKSRLVKKLVDINATLWVRIHIHKSQESQNYDPPSSRYSLRAHTIVFYVLYLLLYLCPYIEYANL